MPPSCFLSLLLPATLHVSISEGSVEINEGYTKRMCGGKNFIAGERGG